MAKKSHYKRPPVPTIVKPPKAKADGKGVPKKLHPKLKG